MRLGRQDLRHSSMYVILVLVGFCAVNIPQSRSGPNVLAIWSKLSIHPSLPTIHCELVLEFGLEIKLQ